MISSSYIENINSSMLTTRARSGYRSEAAHRLDPENRTVSFPDWRLVPQRMDDLIADWNREWPNATRSMPRLARVLARFWHTFLTIHPFANANRRTAEALIVRELGSVGFGFAGSDLVSRVLLANNRLAEIAELEAAFLLSVHHEKELLASEHF